MFIARNDFSTAVSRGETIAGAIEAVHVGLKSLAGLRWAMLLRSQADESRLVALTLVQTREQAKAWQDGVAATSVSRALKASHVYDVVTARGDMTPVRFAALVDWSLEEALRQPFTNRWNAAYHAIEDRLGSRLLQDVAGAASYAGLHIVRDDDASKLDAVANALVIPEGPTQHPGGVERFEAVALTEP